METISWTDSRKSNTFKFVLNVPLSIVDRSSKSFTRHRMILLALRMDLMNSIICLSVVQVSKILHIVITLSRGRRISWETVVVNICMFWPNWLAFSNRKALVKFFSIKMQHSLSLKTSLRTEACTMNALSSSSLLSFFRRARSDSFVFSRAFFGGFITKKLSFDVVRELCSAESTSFYSDVDSEATALSLSFCLKICLTVLLMIGSFASC